ncbi:MAG TPA: BatA and WFA domain-containing protein [Chthoniobacteraceae bacterium]
MRFLDPSQLLWALTAAVPLLLYLFRRKPRRVAVSSLLFFKSLAREHRESAWLRWLKRILSLLLTLLVIAGAVAGLARLVQSPAADSVKSVVIVLDRSASMAARDERGQTRLEAAREAIRTRLAGLPGAVPVMLLAFDQQAEVAAPKSYDRRLVERALEKLEPRPIAGDPASALRLAEQLAALETPAAIWFVSDAPAAPATAEKVRLESIALPLTAPRNIGITAFEIRRVPLEASRCEAFVQVQSAGATEAKVEVRIDGSLTAVRELSLAAGGRESLLLPIEANAGKILSVRALAAGDQLADDDEVLARIPEPQLRRVLWISSDPDPFTQLALTAISREGELAVFRAKPDAWPPKEPVDVVIFQKWLPPAWPADLPAIVIDPPASVGPVQAVRLQGAGLPVERIRSARDRHPLLYGVATGRIALTQTSVLAAEGPLEPLWSGPTGPLLVAGETGGQRLIVFGFAPEQSENLPLSASYPMLLGNAIEWVAQPKTESSGARVQRTGELLALRGQNLTWAKTEATPESRLPLRNGWAPLSRLGLWQTDGGEAGSAALLAASETLLPVGAAVSASGSRTGWLRGDLTAPLLWMVFAVLLVESWLFHRHAVH